MSRSRGLCPEEQQDRYLGSTKGTIHNYKHQKGFNPIAVLPGYLRTHHVPRRLTANLHYM